MSKRKIERCLTINDIMTCVYNDASLVKHTLTMKQGIETKKTCLSMQKTSRGQLRKYFKMFASKHDDHKRRHNFVSLDINRGSKEDIDIYFVDNYLTKILKYNEFASMSHKDIVSYFVDASEKHHAKMSKGLIEVKA